MDDTFDSDADLHLVGCLENVQLIEKASEVSDEDKLLFVRQDGLPMCFYIQDNDYDLKQRIEEKGGAVLEKEVESPLGRNAIKLCPDKLENMISRYEQFNKIFIDDCLINNKIMELSNYRINNSSIFDEYDPLDILLGYKTWDQLNFSEEFTFEEMEEDEEDCNSAINLELTVDSLEALIPEDDIERRGNYCFEEPPVNWEIMTEEEALSFGISFEK